MEKIYSRKTKKRLFVIVIYKMCYNTKLEDM